MVKKYTLDFYDVYEVEKEIGIDWDSCSFAMNINSDDSYYTLYCREEDVKACKENSTAYVLTPAISRGYANTAKWLEYFRSLGYNDTVIIHVYW